MYILLFIVQSNKINNEIIVPSVDGHLFLIILL